jgi:hypothetical protein
MTSPHQVEWPFKDGEGRQTARTALYFLKAFSKAFWNNETHVFIEFLRTFEILSKRKLTVKSASTNKGCGKRQLGTLRRDFSSNIQECRRNAAKPCLALSS